MFTMTLKQTYRFPPENTSVCPVFQSTHWTTLPGDGGLSQHSQLQSPVMNVVEIFASISIPEAKEDTVHLHIETMV